MVSTIEVAVPWKAGFFADQHKLAMLGHTAEVWECADYAGAEWAEWRIWDHCGNPWASGKASSVEGAKRVVTDLIRDRWNAWAAAWVRDAT